MEGDEDVIAHLSDELSGYVDDELDASTRAIVEAHLAQCAECRTLVDRFRAMRRAPLPEAELTSAEIERFVAENRGRRAAHQEETGKVRQLSQERHRPFTSSADLITVTLALAAGFVIVTATFVALGGPLRNMFANSIGTQTMGQNQAALSAGIY